MQKTYKQLLNELGQSGMHWQPGMTLRNTNGDINTTGLGYQYARQTTQLVRAQVIEQKFYEIPIADYIPVVIGQGAWMEGVLTNLTYDSAGDFESGIIDTADPSNLAQVTVGVSPILAKIVTWAKGYEYSVPELEKALATNNWDIVAAKQRALKRNWDLGIQKVAFLGSKPDTVGVPGLLSNPNVNVSTSMIGGAINALTPANFSVLVGSLLGDYFANSNSTQLPDTLVMPMSDYLGLAVPVSATYPTGGSMLDYLTKAFQTMTQSQGFKIMGCAYCNQAANAGYWAVGGTNRYALYKRDPEVVRMDIPVDFFLNPPGTGNNFNFQGVGAGQFTGAQVYRPASIRYYDWHV